ncbi:MAG: hypothetical protein DHS20C01_33750 [marine bacterium B5-7]|nr:MAG: hypothetical protein DHS20C01_33750 [marine bacterium B5-7]
MNDLLWGICVFFNPAGFKTKAKNFRTFRKLSRQQGINLLVVELIIGGQSPSLSDTDADIHIVINGTADNHLWQKEALLNIALDNLPTSCDFVAWIDADVIFANDNWVCEAIDKLQHSPVVQLYSTFVQLPYDFNLNVLFTDDMRSITESISSEHSFAAGLRQYGSNWLKPFGRTGNAWAARREILERHRFFDAMILGDADSFMAYAFVNHEPFLSRVGNDFPSGLISYYHKWARNIHADVNGSVDVVDGTLYHLWHGSVENRGYAARRQILKRHNYNPQRDIERDSNGLLAWTVEVNAAFKSDVIRYFNSRGEDSTVNTVHSSKHLLITGMSGLIGGIVGRALAPRYPIRALSRHVITGTPTVIADIRDVEALHGAFNGIHTVIHFAAYCGGDGITNIDVNIRGTYNLFEAAVAAGVKRFIFISTGAVQQMFEFEEPSLASVQGRLDDIPDPPFMISATDPVRPMKMYGASKACAEIIGRMYAETGKLSVICLRLGRVRPEDRATSHREAAVYLSHRDVVQLVEKGIEAPEELRFGIYYGVSDNRTRFRDLAAAERDLGFIPKDGIRSDDDWQTLGDS